MTHPTLHYDGMTRPRDAARVMGVSVATLYRWAREGRCPAPMAISANVSAIRNADLLEWLADPTAWRGRGAAMRQTKAA